MTLPTARNLTKLYRYKKSGIGVNLEHNWFTSIGYAFNPGLFIVVSFSSEKPCTLLTRPLGPSFLPSEYQSSLREAVIFIMQRAKKPSSRFTKWQLFLKMLYHIRRMQTHFMLPLSRCADTFCAFSASESKSRLSGLHNTFWQSSQAIRWAYNQICRNFLWKEYSTFWHYPYPFLHLSSLNVTMLDTPREKYSLILWKLCFSTPILEVSYILWPISFII